MNRWRCRRTVRPSLIVITRWCTCWGGSSSFRAGNGTRPRTLESSSLYRWLWCFKKKSRYRYYRVSFDRETRISDWFNTFRAEVCGNRAQRKECRPRQSYWNSKSGKEDNNPVFIVPFKKISSSKCCFKLKKLKTTFNAKNRRKSPPWRILIFDKATKKRKTIEKK